MQNPISRLANPYRGAFDREQTNRISADQIGGECDIAGPTAYNLTFHSEEDLVLLRRAIWDAIRHGSRPFVDDAFVERALRSAEPPFAQKALEVLDLIRRRSPFLSHGVEFYNRNSDSRAELEAFTIMCLPTGYGNSDPLNVNTDRGLMFCLQYLKESDLVGLHSAGTGTLTVGLTPKGLIHLEEQAKKTSNSSQGFVAMWFAEETRAAWQDGIEPAILAAGYTPFRIDQHTHETRIDDEIVSQIRQSRFLVADFTCGVIENEDAPPVHVVRGGVYFEAGLAAGLDIPVIWTVRDDRLGGLHFDTRQYPHIVWSTPEDLRAKLEARVIALLGPGPSRPPIAVGG